MKLNDVITEDLKSKLIDSIGAKAYIAIENQDIDIQLFETVMNILVEMPKAHLAGALANIFCQNEADPITAAKRLLAVSKIV